MANNYNGRRAPNVSQYIANLNTIPSAADLAAPQDFGNFDDDLAMFTNTQFFDFDMNENVPDLPQDMSFPASQAGSQNALPQDSAKNLNFVNQQTFQFPDFSTFSQPQRLSSQGLPPSPPNGMAFPSHGPAQMAPQPAFSHASPQTGEKRKSAAASISSPADLEDQGRYAAEEDKRRRNTAASARFRVKKKQREQALEKTSREMSEKVSVLEARVGQLEMENKWLKGLITEKNLKGVTSPVAMPKNLPPAASDNETTQKEDGERSTEERKDGVGTDDKAATQVAA
ncbi:hypothetical protein MBLNU459_g5622t1 [Dothideomycetes sp. NU459]